MAARYCVDSSHLEVKLSPRVIASDCDGFLPGGVQKFGHTLELEVWGNHSRESLSKYKAAKSAAEGTWHDKVLRS